jgi:ferritin
MLNKKVEEILNVQVEKEGYSSNLYLAMASWAETKGYEGIANGFTPRPMKSACICLR